MKKLITICVVLLAISAQSRATMVIGFDDLSTPYTGSGIADWGFVPTSYQGLTWTGFEVLNGDGPGNNYKTVYGNSYGPTSSHNFAYNGDDGYLITTVADPFNFISADFTSFVQNDTYQSFSARSLTLTGYVGNTVVYTLSVNPLPTNKFTTVTANFIGIDTLEIKSDAAGHYWGMDNFTVPEPATIGLLSLGALSLLRRKR
jgi:hypothetical protein